MREESYTQALLDMALLKAGGKRITEIRFGVGQFSAIRPAAVEMVFGHLSKGTPAQEANLVFETIPVELTCTACGKTVVPDIPLNMPIRPALALALGHACACGARRLKITGGLGFDLIGLSVDDETPHS